MTARGQDWLRTLGGQNEWLESVPRQHLRHPLTLAHARQACPGDLAAGAPQLFNDQGGPTARREGPCA